MKYPLYCLLLASGSFLAGCSEDDDPAATQPELEIKEVTDLNADKAANEGHFVFYSLEDGKTVPYADSASNNWDIAFSHTDIILNGGVSGPGNAAGQIVSGIFEELSEAPEAGYQEDTEAGPAFSSDWYHYTMFDEPKHAVLPLAGTILLVKTTGGGYAKIEVISYYKGNPDTSSPDFADPEARTPAHYTFRYVYQPDGRAFQ